MRQLHRWARRPARPRRAAPLPVELDAVVLRACICSPLRQQSAGELVRELRAAAALAARLSSASGAPTEKAAAGVNGIAVHLERATASTHCCIR